MPPTLLQSPRWRQLVCLKYWHISTKLHSVFVKSQLYVCYPAECFCNLHTPTLGKRLAVCKFGSATTSMLILFPTRHGALVTAQGWTKAKQIFKYKKRSLSNVMFILYYLGSTDYASWKEMRFNSTSLRNVWRHGNLRDRVIEGKCDRL